MGAVGTTAVTSLPSAMEITSQDQIKQLQQEMGQTGMEAGNPNETPNGKLYAKTGKAFNINAFLNSDGATILSDYSNWNGLVDKPWVQNAIKQLDKGMKPLSQAVQVSRYVDGDSLGYMVPGMGVDKSNFNTFLGKLESGEISPKAFQTALKDVNYTHKGYTSTTYEKSHGSYGGRDVRLNIVMRQGTPSIVTNNHAEHEIVAGRNLPYHFTGGYHVDTLPSGKKQLVLDMYV